MQHLALLVGLQLHAPGLPQSSPVTVLLLITQQIISVCIIYESDGARHNILWNKED